MMSSLGLFMSCDINMPSMMFLPSQPSRSGQSSNMTSKDKSNGMFSQLQTTLAASKMSQLSQLGQQMSQAVLSQRGGSGLIGDGNSLRNQLALQSMRDISSYDVKKVKFAEDGTADQENQPANELANKSKNYRNALKNKKQEELEEKRAKVLSALDLNEEPPVQGKLAKQLHQLRKARGGNKKIPRKTRGVTWSQVIEERPKNVVPLNLNIDLKRLTQLFGRSLYIKYFIKNAEIKRLSSGGRRSIP